MKNWRGILIAVVCGYAIWALSPAYAGRVEPWDAKNAYYWAGLLVSGILVGLAEPRKFLTSSLWIVVGQALFVLKGVVFEGKDLGLLIPMGLLAMLFLSAPCYLGAYLGAQFRPNK